MFRIASTEEIGGNPHKIELPGIGQEAAIGYRASRARWLRAVELYRSKKLTARAARWIGQRYGGLPDRHPMWGDFV